MSLTQTFQLKKINKKALLQIKEIDNENHFNDFA